MRDRTRARELAAEFHRKGDPTGWFEVLYREAEEGRSTVPWADYHPTPLLVGFWMKHPLDPAEKTALVTGCGLGDDAEQLARWGFRTTAAFAEHGLEELLFDILPDVEEPDVRRFRVLFRFPEPSTHGK